MRKNLTMLVLATMTFYCCGQNRKVRTDKVISDVKTVDTKTKYESRMKSFFPEDSDIHTETTYSDNTGKGIMIQNSFPKGGAFSISANEKEYGYAVFWTRVVNNEDETLELTLNFPSDSIIIVPTSNVHFKLLVPPDTMTLDKVSRFNFGLKEIQTFVDKNFHQTSQLQRSINPNEDFMFYIILLSHLSPSDKGVTRTGLFLEGQDLFYKLNDMDSSNSKLVPCGQISLSNKGQ